MKYTQKTTITVDQNPNGSYEVEVEKSLLVSDTIYSWDADHSRYGYNSYDIRPCFHGGEKAFLLEWSWCPAPGYSAQGEGEEILTFENGVKLLIEHGAYAKMFADV